MSPIAPTFSYSGTNLHLSASGTDSGGVCNATNSAGNGSFQIINGDILATNGALTAGNKSICVAASKSGVAATGQPLTIAVGTLRDAAAGAGTGGCTGNGTSGSPWNYACIQNAVNSSVDGDTVFLRGGNWALNTTTDANHVVIYNKAINLVGVASGNTFDAWGHINNPKPTPDLCPTSGTSITCVYQTGKSYNNNTCPGFPWHCPGAIFIGPPENSSADPACHDVSVSGIYFDGSLTTAGGGLAGLLYVSSCTGPTLINDVRFLAATNIPVSGGGTSYEGQFVTAATENVTILNSLFADPLLPGGVYSGAQALQLTGGNGIGNNYLIQNNVIYQGALNAIYLSHVVFTGNQTYNYNDGTGDTAIDPAAGYAGASVGGLPCGETGISTGRCSGDIDLTLTNSLWYAGKPGLSGSHTIAIGSTVNDPSTSGGIINLNITGNWVIGNIPDIDSCTWHLFNDEGNCNPGGIIGMTINTSVDINCNQSNYGLPFAVTNNSLLGSTGAYLNAAGSVSTSGGPGSDWISCNGAPSAIPIRVYGYNAQKNYLSSANNQYVTNSNTISPTQANNFCSPNAGSVTGCQTNLSNWTTAPTASFSLGPLGVGNIVPIRNTTFTAQYGAVQWLASTSSTAPLANDTRWSSNNAGFPNSQANTYIPPVSLSGVHHGDTVHLWVMDSGNHISAATPQVVP
jgi:hypothetical protein